MSNTDFDPDAYLSGPAAAPAPPPAAPAATPAPKQDSGFDPNAYLAQPAGGFDPDAYLKSAPTGNAITDIWPEEKRAATDTWQSVKAGLGPENTEQAVKESQSTPFWDLTPAINSTLRTGRAIGSALAYPFQAAVGAPARSLIGHPLASAEQALGTNIDPQKFKSLIDAGVPKDEAVARATETPQQSYERWRGNVDTALSAIKPAGAPIVSAQDIGWRGLPVKPTPAPTPPAQGPFGVTLSKGQDTGDLLAIQREQAARRGLSGERALARAEEFDEQQQGQLGAARQDIVSKLGTTPVTSAQEASDLVTSALGQQQQRIDALVDRSQQAINGLHEANRSVLSPTGSVLARDPMEAADILQRGVDNAAERAQLAKQQAYKSMEDSDVVFHPAAFNGAADKIRAAVDRASKIDINPESTPIANQALSKLDSIFSDVAQQRDEAGRIIPKEPITPQALEDVRKRLNVFMGQARASAQVGKPADAVAMRGVIDAFDDLVEDRIVKGTVTQGDPVDALSKMRFARGLNAAYRKTFTPQGAGDSVGQAIQKIIGRYEGQAATPEQVSNMLYGPNARPLALRLQAMFPEGSPELAAVKQGFYSHITERPPGATAWGPEKVADRIDQYTKGPGRTLTQTYLSPEEISRLQDFAQRLRQHAQFVEQAKNPFEGLDWETVLRRAAAGDQGALDNVSQAQARLAITHPDVAPALKQGLFLRSLQRVEGVPESEWGPAKTADNITRLLNKTRNSNLYSADERDMLGAYSDLLRKLQVPQAGANWSNTATFMQQYLKRFGGLIGIVVGDALLHQMGVGYPLSEAIAIGGAGAAREAAGVLSARQVAKQMPLLADQMARYSKAYAAWQRNQNVATSKWLGIAASNFARTSQSLGLDLSRLQLPGIAPAQEQPPVDANGNPIRPRAAGGGVQGEGNSEWDQIVNPVTGRPRIVITPGVDTPDNPASPASAPQSPAEEFNGVGLGHPSGLVGKGLEQASEGESAPPEAQPPPIESVPGVGAVPASSDTDYGNKPVNRLLGAGGEERYQTWPERMIRSGTTLAGDVMSGKEPDYTGLRREDYTDIPVDESKREGGFWPFNKLAPVSNEPQDALIQRAQDMAALAGGAGMPSAEEGALGMAGGKGTYSDLLSNQRTQEGLKLAVKDNTTGKIYTNAGATDHAEINTPDTGPHEPGRWEDGFLNKSGQWLTREQAEAYVQNPKSKTAMFRSDTQQPGAALSALEHTQPFYSAVEQAITNAPQQKMHGSQWFNWLKNQPGIKQEELDWLGLKDNPDLQGLQTKQQLLDHVQGQGVGLKEVEKSVNLEDYDQIKAEAQRLLEQERPDLEPGTNEYNNKLEDYYASIGRQTNSTTKYSDYQLPGGDNYRELLLTMPGKSRKPYTVVNQSDGSARVVDALGNEQGRYFGPPVAANEAYRLNQMPESTTYQSSHWDEPNVLAHLRMNDRDIPGVGKSLHLEELQSDWHQQGRKQGYIKEQPQFWVRNTRSGNNSPFFDTMAEADAYRNALPESTRTSTVISQRPNKTGTVPDAPFKSTWPDLLLKRAITKAAQEGKDAISWTPGEQQAARYDLSKQVDQVSYDPKTERLLVWGKEANRSGPVIDKVVPTKDLPNVIGKEAADKVLNNPTKTMKDDSGEYNVLRGLDLKVGGEGLKSFYDSTLVNKANAIGKKYGAKVEWNNLPKDKLALDDVKTILTGEGITPKDWHSLSAVGQQRLASKYNVKPPSLKVPVLRLTPQLKQQALTRGMPLFSDTSKPGAALSGLKRQQLSNKLDTTVRGQFNSQALDTWQKQAPDKLYHGTNRNLKQLQIFSLPSHAAVGGGHHLPGIYLTDNPALARSFGKNVYEVSGLNKKRLYPDPEVQRGRGSVEPGYHAALYTKDIPKLDKFEAKGLPITYDLSKAYLEQPDSVYGFPTIRIDHPEHPLGLDFWGGSKMSAHLGRFGPMMGKTTKIVSGIATHDFNATHPELVRNWSLPINATTRQTIEPTLENLWHQNKNQLLAKTATEIKQNLGSDVAYKGEIPPQLIRQTIKGMLDSRERPFRASGGSVNTQPNQQHIPRPIGHQQHNSKPEHLQGFAAGGRVDPSQIDRNPSAAQIKSGTYSKDHVHLHGLAVTIENAKGSTRSGVDKNGRQWTSALPSHYGYIKKTVGSDSDHLDVYLGPHTKAPHVFIIDQLDKDTKKWDEHKIGLGFGSKNQFVQTYKRAFSDGKASARIGAVHSMTLSQFKSWLEHGDTTVPYKEPEHKKLSHKFVGYEPIAAKPNRHCGVCRYFISAEHNGPACTLVENPIDPGAWCRRFRRKT